MKNHFNIVILDADTLGKDMDLSILEEFGDVKIYPTTSLSDREKRVKNAHIVITNKVVIDKEIFDKCENLKLICISATGMNNVDLEYAKQKGVEVKNVAGYSTSSVAQYTLMQTLSLYGKSRQYDSYVKSGEWAKSEIFVNLDFPFHDIKDKKWGIIGLGAIGKEVARLASAFGCEVCYHSTSGKNSDQTYKQVSLNKLLTSCDIISIHAPLNENTNNLLDKNELALLKQDVILVNVARGGIVNEKSLCEMIKKEKIYAVVDVLTRESMSKESPFFGLISDRILFSPHIAWASVEARGRLINGVVENIKTFIKGQ